MDGKRWFLLLALTCTAVTSAVTSVEARLRAAKLKLEGNNESSPLLSGTSGTNQRCQHSPVWVSKCWRSSTKQLPLYCPCCKSAGICCPPPPPPPIPSPSPCSHSFISYHAGVCVSGVCGTKSNYSLAPCVHLLMKTMIRFNWNLRIFSAASQKQERFTLGWRWLRWKRNDFLTSPKTLEVTTASQHASAFPPAARNITKHNVWNISIRFEKKIESDPQNSAAELFV